MGQFEQFIFFEEIESVFDEIDIFNEAEEAFALLEAQFDSLRNRRLSQARFLDPQTNKVWRNVDKVREVQAIVTHEVKVNGTPKNRIWLTFSDVKKLGQRTSIGPTKTTPVGIFAYPVSFALKRNLKVPFGTRAYIHIFKTKSAHFEGGGGPESTKENDFGVVKTTHGLKKPSVEDDPKYKEFTIELRVWHRKFYEEANALLSGQTNEQQLQAIKNWGQDLFYRIKDGVNVYAETPWSKKIQDLIEAQPWLKNPQEAVSQIIAGDENKIIQQLKSYIQHLEVEVYGNNFYKNVLKYINVGDDLSAQMTPEWIAYIKQYANHYEKLYPGVVEIANTNGRVPFDVLRKVEQYAFSADSIGGDYLRAKENVVLANNPTVMKVIQDYVLGISQIVEKFGHDASAPEAKNNNIPYGDRLKKYADDNGLDYEKAIKFAVRDSPKTVYTPNQFLYRVTQDLATQLSGKRSLQGVKSDWRMAWSKVLRDLGISSVADTQNSGHIHSAEPTQGVFMDPRDITLIATITQSSHSDQLDPASRPALAADSFDTWSSHEKQHNRVALPRNQRFGRSRPTDQVKGEKGADRFYIGINSRLFLLKRELSLVANYGGTINSNNASQLDSMLTNIIKLAKIYNNLVKKGYKPSEKVSDKSAGASFEKHMTDIVKMAKQLITNSPNTDEKIKNKVETLDFLSNPNFPGVIKTGIYKKRRPEDFASLPKPQEDEDEEEEEVDPFEEAAELIEAGT